MKELIELFDGLNKPQDNPGLALRFSACRIPDFANHRLAKNNLDLPCLLLHVEDVQPRKLAMPIELEHITIIHNVSCRIEDSAGKVEQGIFTVLLCTKPDRTLHEYFLRVGNALIHALGDQPGSADVNKSIQSIIELFQAISRPGKKSVSGLWGELFLIEQSSNPIALMQAWHQTNEDRYDFSIGEQRIEVKSTASKTRRHHFTLEQLHPPSGTSVLVASVIIESAGSGTSVSDLVDKISSRVLASPELLIHLEIVTASIIGENWRYAVRDRYDYQLAAESLLFFNTTQIPSVSPNMPASVSDVHFVVDLSDVPSAEIYDYDAAGGIFKAVQKQELKTKRRHA